MLACEMYDNELFIIRNLEIGSIFQDYNLVPALNALENVELLLIYQSIPAWQRRENIRQLLEQAGLGGLASQFSPQMFGGQQQVTIARATSDNTPILTADKPTGTLGSKTGVQVLEIMHQLHQESGTTVILILPQ